MFTLRVQNVISLLGSFAAGPNTPFPVQEKDLVPDGRGKERRLLIFLYHKRMEPIRAETKWLRKDVDSD